MTKFTQLPWGCARADRAGGLERFADGAIWTGWRNKRLARRVYTSRPICADCFSEAAHGTAKGDRGAVVAGFHILEGVTLPNGVVKTANGTFDYTNTQP